MRAFSWDRAVIALAALLTSAAAGGGALGCRGILGIEDRVLTDGGADAGLGLTCADYCAAITASCTGGNKQYGSETVCLGFCASLAPGALGDVMKDTLGCRINVLASASSMLELADCAAAGPGGNGTCGSNCEGFCDSAIQVCPQDFESVGDCMSACTPLIACGTYHVGENTPDNPSIQCRLFHMSAAAEGWAPAEATMTVSQVTHCPHVKGEILCVVPDAGAVAADCNDGGP